MFLQSANVYGFKYYAKSSLASEDVYELFRSSRLMSSRRTVEAISKMHDELVVMLRHKKRICIYTREDKIEYEDEGDSKLDRSHYIPLFLNSKMLDFILLRFKQFHCALSRQERDVCTLHLLYTHGKKGAEERVAVLKKPSLLLGEITDRISTVQDRLFSVENFSFFKDEELESRVASVSIKRAAGDGEEEEPNVAGEDHASNRENKEESYLTNILGFFKEKSKKKPKDTRVHSAKIDKISFGVRTGKKLEYVENKIAKLSLGKIEDLEKTLISIIKAMDESTINYVEINSDVDICIVKDGGTSLYLMDAVLVREGKVLDSLYKMVGNIEKHAYVEHAHVEQSDKEKQ
jgi:hypothetical protein